MGKKQARMAGGNLFKRINCRGTIVQSVVKICYQNSIIKVCATGTRRGKPRGKGKENAGNRLNCI